MYKKNLSGHRVQSKKNRLDLQVTLKIDLKVMMVKVMSFLRHLTLNFYLSQVTKTIFPQVIFYVKFPALFKYAVKNRGSHLKKGSYLHLTFKIDLKVKIDGTVKCPPRSWSTFVQAIFSWIKYFRSYLGL